MEIAVNFVMDHIQQHIPTLADHTLLLRLMSNYIVFVVGGFFFYLAFASFSYAFFFRWGKETFYPKTLPNDLTQQIKTEIRLSSISIPWMGVLMTPFPTALQLGYGKMYYDIADYGWGYVPVSIALFLFSTDFMVYWVHRILHVGWIYKNIHKPHHTFRFTTPFSSHAFHPVDGWAQGVTYYIAAFVFPIHHILFVILFILVNFWTISIHDQVDFQGAGIINSTGHHTIHHADFVYNYGQYFTFWDRICGTYKPAHQTHHFSDLFGSHKVAAKDA